MIEINIAIGEPAIRRRIYEQVEKDGYHFATLIHPSVAIPDSAEILTGTTICAFSFISCNVKIGVNTYIQPQAMIGHDCILGNHVVVSPCAALAGGCSVGEGTYIGMGAMVKEKTAIGEWAIIGMGSCVYQGVKDKVIAIGNPARVMKTNDDQKVFR